MDLASSEVVLERAGEAIADGRDISRPGEALKLAIELAGAGRYLVHFLGLPTQISATRQFALLELDVDGVEEHDVELLLLLADADRDGFPPCGPPSWLTCGQVSCPALDCDDRDKAVNAFAAEVCGNGKDDDCSAGCGAKKGEGDEPCKDEDGDGAIGADDCDDSDPCRSAKIPEARNLCQLSAADFVTAATKACRDKLGAAFKAPLCGDKVDNDCDDRDVECFVDDDCDGYSPPGDCDDRDAAINQAAQEVCDGKDNNCNQVVDEGCVPCDVDGDQHAAKAGPGCTLPGDDPDDNDAGVNPDVTKETGGLEGGEVLTALRGFCSSSPDKNGTPTRDVDHDGDGKAAKDDGCPTTTCDVDGDGYEGAQCSPQGSKLDCDDADPQTFPGAPDRCGDSKAQDCVADRDCSCDKDGDGFCPPPQPNPQNLPGDCNDGDKLVHPWAKELCDRIDNDCDGLIDEGNPDMTGTPIPTNKKLCNDDNDGECAPAAAKLSGICVCSALKPNAKRDPAGNRTSCAGEDLKAAASPRCFGARQPQMEQCDALDHNCDGKPYVPGEPFVGLGTVCGTDVGQCVSGKVEGCNVSKPVDARVGQVLAAQGAAFKPGWVCSSSTVLPGVELCNGLDDDCDGLTEKPAGVDPGWAEVGEKDADGDGFLACTGCKPPLPAPLLGCGDCEPAQKAVYPGAAELCNGVDDNCLAGKTDDGKDQCFGGTTCCPAVKICVDLDTSIDHCGACGAKCPANLSDSCQGGTCVCDGEGVLCAPPECHQATCETWGCDVISSPDTTPCQGGLCRSGTCCQGCWDGKNSCKDGAADDRNCGQGGVDCVNCKDAGQSCVNHKCT
jgi:hypothetical protein